MSKTSAQQISDGRLTISIALATYNGSKFVEAQLRSLAEQSYLPAEIVVTDDGSTDDTLERIAAFATTAPFPIHIHRNEGKLGYRKNFLKAASLCTSDIVAFCDQDDIWHTDKLHRVAAAFADSEVQLVCHNASVVDKEGNFIRPMHPENAYAARLEAMDGSPWEFLFGFTISFRRRLIAFLSLHEGSSDPNHQGELLGHDQWVTLLASAFGRKIYIDAPLVDYRQHGNNTFGVDRDGGQPLLERMHLKIEDRAAFFGRLRRVSQINAKIIGQIATFQDVTPAEASRCLQAAERWESLSELYSLRAKAYSEPSIFQRIASVSRLKTAGAYGDKGIWSYGKKAFARDILLGVLAGPLITRLGAKPSNYDSSLRALIPLAS